MASISSGKRNWKCPECGKEVQLSTTQLDPIACDECLAKMKRGVKTRDVSTAATASTGAMGLWSSVPDVVKLALVFVTFIVGMMIGFVAGWAIAPRSSGVVQHPAKTRETSAPKPTNSQEDTDPAETSETTEDHPPAPGPGYKWVRGRKQDDGTRGRGHWAKDPRYHAADDSTKP